MHVNHRGLSKSGKQHSVGSEENFATVQECVAEEFDLRRITLVIDVHSALVFICDATVFIWINM